MCFTFVRSDIKEDVERMKKACVGDLVVVRCGSLRGELGFVVGMEEKNKGLSEWERIYEEGGVEKWIEVMVCGSVVWLRCDYVVVE